MGRSAKSPDRLHSGREVNLIASEGLPEEFQNSRLERGVDGRLVSEGEGYPEIKGEINTVTKRKGNLTKFHINFGSLRVSTLWDTGAEATLVSLDTYNKIPDQYKSKVGSCNVTLTGLGNTKIKALGWSKIEFGIGKKLFDCKVLVVPNLCMNHDIIFGKDNMKLLQLEYRHCPSSKSWWITWGGVQADARTGATGFTQSLIGNYFNVLTTNYYNLSIYIHLIHAYRTKALLQHTVMECETA